MRPRSLTLAAAIMLAFALAACAPQAAPLSTASSTAPRPPASPLPASSGLPIATETPGAAQTLRPTDTPSIVQESTATKIPSSSSQGLPNTGAGPADVAIGQNAKLGAMLVDGKGMTLYALTEDSPNTPTCYGQCAATWPALKASGRPTAGEGVDASKLGTTLRTDGIAQITYNGWPLYYFANDQKPGDANGQGVGGVWFAVSPEGDPLK